MSISPPFSRIERTALADALDHAGPEAPTLCSGWTTRELAAHLVLRDRRIDAMPGIVIGAFAGHTAAVQRQLAQRPYPELVTAVHQGAPWWSPTGFPLTEPLVNTAEFFVHHEDIRRASAEWTPRVLSAGLDDTLWRMLRARSRMLFRASPVAVTLRKPDGSSLVGRQGRSGVTLTGTPSELTLYAFGRTTAATVDIAGEPADRQRFAETRLNV
jgi:uncharacterized protein (TIGR03085 family)